MKIKSLFVIIIIMPILTFPYVSGYLEFSDKDKVINDENPLNGGDRIWVKFCYGNISNLFEMKSGYTTYAYGFNAEDVICIINYTDKPLYHHLTGGIKCAIDMIPFLPFFWIRLRGTVSDDFIYASYGPISPKILLLLYLHFNN